MLFYIIILLNFIKIDRTHKSKGCTKIEQGIYITSSPHHIGSHFLSSLSLETKHKDCRMI